MTKIRLKGLSVLAVLTVLLFGSALFLRRPDRLWIQAMIALAGLESLIGFGSLIMAMRHSDNVFYSVFVLGTLSRLVLLGLAAFVLYRWAPSVALPLVSLVLSYFFFSIIQIPFLLQANNASSLSAQTQGG